MARQVWHPHSRPCASPFDSEKDSPDDGRRSVSPSPAARRRSCAPVLAELSVAAVQNTQPGASVSRDHWRASTSAESLARELENFHIYSPPKNGLVAVEKKSACKASVPPAKNTSTAPAITPALSSAPAQSTHLEQEESQQTQQTPADSELQRRVEAHGRGQFEWVLSLPTLSGFLGENKHLRRFGSDTNVADCAQVDREVYFGCNLLQRRPRSKSDLASQAGSTPSCSYTLIATPLGSIDRRQPNPEASARSAADMPAATLAPEAAMASVEESPTPSTQIQASPKVLAEGLDIVLGSRAQSIPRSPCSSVSRIEDTIEELDRLEDEFEAVKKMVHIARVPSPDKTAGTQQPARLSTSSAKKPVLKASTNSAAPAKGATRMSRAASVRKPAPTAASVAATTEPTVGTAPTVNKRLSVSRPQSLLPPKPPARSSKPPTVANFELPGEAVARRLKEQREARLAASKATAAGTAGAGATTAAKPGIRRTRSTKPLTIPTFELPGEPISRRKREEHQAKIRQQEEEERKRREFKARPIRMSITPGTLPRDTIASRARQNRVLEGVITGPSRSSAAGDGNNKAATAAATAAPTSKRLSVTSSDAAGRSVNQHHLAPRGRLSNADSSLEVVHASRAASTSTGSVSGKRSSVSADEVQCQKVRGREIYHRDSLLAVDRDREKKERESSAKVARQEAAERSRTLSREWAEKQKLRAKKMAAAVTASVGTAAKAQA